MKGFIMKKLNIGNVYTVELSEGYVTDVVIDSEYNDVEGGYWAIDSEGNDVVVKPEYIIR